MVDAGGTHVRRLVLVVQEVDSADRSNDSARPGIWTILEQGRGALAAQLLSQLSAEHGVYFDAALASVEEVGAVRTVTPDTLTLHGQADEVVALADREEFLKFSRATHREPMAAMLKVCEVAG